MEINDLLEPNKVYETQLMDAHHQNAIDWFEELTNTSEVNIDANRETCKNYYKTEKEINEIKKKITGIKVGRGFAIFMLVLGIILMGVGVFLLVMLKDMGNSQSQLITAIIMLVVGLGMTVGAPFIIAKCNKLLKNNNAIKQKLEEKAEQLLREAWAQMGNLNELFDYNMGAELVKKSAPLIQLDPIFDVKKYAYLHEKYGLMPNNDENISTLDCLTGSILGNPFMFEREYEMRMENYTYSNSITITWTTYTYDSKGNRISQTHSQVLTAEVTAPKPNYYHSTWLIYGNGAAPNLKFSRQPSNINSFKDQKAIDKYCMKHQDDLAKRAQKQLEKGKTYTPLGNTEFELFFGALNRNNEVEFRLLFTPLAQKSMLDLIKDPHPYGDDFTFIKEGPLNFIHSNHMQNANIFVTPEFFMGFDYDKMKTNWVNYHDKYLASVFFDLAPLLCIPLYQQYKDINYIYPGYFDSNICCYEHEVMANKFDERLLVHKRTKTPAIIKTNLINKVGDMDNVQITAHSFDRIERVTVISKMGGDGYMHDIPVTWYEYPPLINYTTMAIKEYNKTLKQMNEELYSNKEFSSFINNKSKNNGIIFQRGLLSFLTNNNVNENDVNALKNILKK